MNNYFQKPLDLAYMFFHFEPDNDFANLHVHVHVGVYTSAHTPLKFLIRFIQIKGTVWA
jgi:hypothetical protein